MRLMIAGADIGTVSRLAAHLTAYGHTSVFARNGRECRAALRSFIPDLLIMEFDILWGGSDGVMEAMKGDSQSKDVPVVLFTESHKQLALSALPRIIATLTNPLKPHELSRLNELLAKMNSTCAGNSLYARRIGQPRGNRQPASSALVPNALRGSAPRPITIRIRTGTLAYPYSMIHWQR